MSRYLRRSFRIRISRLPISLDAIFVPSILFFFLSSHFVILLSLVYCYFLARMIPSVERFDLREREREREREKLSNWTDFQSWVPEALIEPCPVAFGWKRKRSVPHSQPAALPDAAASWRSTATGTTWCGADSIIIIKFNWPRYATANRSHVLKRPRFSPGCFPSDRFCFVPRRASIRSVKSVEWAISCL